MIDKDQLLQLTAAVTNWVRYNENPPADEMSIIKAFTPMFKYSGQMYRTVFLFDKGDLPYDLESYLLNHQHGSRIAAWAKTLDGMYAWLNKTGDDIHFDDDDEAVHEVLCIQTGMGFDIELFNNYLVENNPELANYSTRLGASVHEVIAPYYPTSLKATIEQTHENDTWDEDEDEDD